MQTIKKNKSDLINYACVIIKIISIIIITIVIILGKASVFYYPE